MVFVRDMLEELTRAKYEFSFIGDENGYVEGFCSLKNPKDKSLMWIKHATDDALSNFASSDCVIVSNKPVDSSKSVSFIVVKDPKAVFFHLLEHFWEKEKRYGIGKTSVVETSNIGEDVFIGEHCYIGENVVIGKGCRIGNNVSIVNHVQIGDDCEIHSGVVIGEDGFGFYSLNGVFQKVDHFGGVKIGNRVHIGENSCIIRGTIDDTYIGDDTKIDCLVQIAHNVNIGKCCTIIAGSVVCGSAVLGDNAYIAPSSIVKNQVSVGKNAFVCMGAVVTQNVEDGCAVVSEPSKNVRENIARFLKRINGIK